MVVKEELIDQEWVTKLKEQENRDNTVIGIMKVKLFTTLKIFYSKKLLKFRCIR